MWTLDSIDRARRERAPDLQRVVVGIDPAVSTSEGSDETGIIVCGRDDRGHGYVLEDLSGRYDPAGWARAAIDAYHRHDADRIVAEVNQGGDMVENTLRTIDPNISLHRCSCQPREIYAGPNPSLRFTSRAGFIMSATFPSLKIR